jgi:hypothetical protein
MNGYIKPIVVGTWSLFYDELPDDAMFRYAYRLSVVGIMNILVKSVERSNFFNQ